MTSTASNPRNSSFARFAPADRWQALGRLARGQYGLVTAWQMEDAGFDANARQWLRRTGRVVVVRHGVYRLLGVAPTWRSSALAAVLAAGPRAVLSHRSAGALWDLFEEQDLRGALHVISASQVRAAGVSAHRQRLLAGDSVRRHLIPVTSIERTLIDLAAEETPVSLGRLIDECIRRGFTTPGRLQQAAQAHQDVGARNMAAMWAALSDRGVGYDPGANDWEYELDQMWDQVGLPPAERQYTIVVASGRKYRPDRVILDARMAIDWNGHCAHGLRSDFEHDIERRNALMAAGWAPLEFHSNQAVREICTVIMAVYLARTSTSLPAS